MTPLIAILLALAGAEPRLTGVSVAPVADRTEVVIVVDGAVSERHFMLDDGRLVLDLTGVPQPPRLDLRDFNRGGVRELRIGPFEPNVARIVMALDRPLDYDVTRDGDRIRITFANPAGTFEPWTHNVDRDRSAAAARSNGGTSSAPAGQPRQQVRPAPPEPRQQVPAQRQQVRQEQVRVAFSDEPLGNVLALFSEYAGRTILASPEVQGRRITAELRGVPWEQALEGILEAYGMAIRALPSGLLLVEERGAVTERAQIEPPITRTFAIQYISADSIRQAVQGLLTPAGRVTVNTASNALLVTDARSAVERVSEVIPQLDVKTPQVDISATIAFIDRTTLESLGVVYDLKDSRGSQFNRLVAGFEDRDGDGVLTPDERTSQDLVLLSGTSVAALGNANFRVATPALELVSTLVLGRHSLVTFLEALQTVSLSDIQAKPVIRTMDHRQASIQVGEETPIRVIDAGGGGVAGGQAPRATVNLRNTGVILEVTPHITGNQVLLDMRAERSNVAAATSDVGLIFQTQNATTQVLVDDGETVVIGGLTIIEKTRSRAGIPLLMDLPVIGALFRNETERENKRDLLIMVTPHIVRD